MAQTNLYIGKTTNNAGESEISMRLYISRDIRIRVSSGIWVDHKRWGKKNEINIPIILGEERQKLLEKRGKLKSLIDFLENSINTADDKSIINKEFIPNSAIEKKEYFSILKSNCVAVEKNKR